MLKTQSSRQADMAKIHIAIKQLGMSDADHRRRLMEAFGKDSSAGLTDSERKRYLADLRKLGFKAKPRAGTKIDRTQDMHREIQKARAIWLMMHHIGVVRDPAESAMVAWGKRQGKVDAMQWQRRPDLLIEALKKWAMRHLPQWCESQQQFKDAAHAVALMQIQEVRHQFHDGHINVLVKSLQSCVPSALFDIYSDIWHSLARRGAPNVS